MTERVEGCRKSNSSSTVYRDVAEAKGKKSAAGVCGVACNNVRPLEPRPIGPKELGGHYRGYTGARAKLPTKSGHDVFAFLDIPYVKKDADAPPLFRRVDGLRLQALAQPDYPIFVGSVVAQKDVRFRLGHKDYGATGS
jgi:hypothetical protein